MVNQIDTQPIQVSITRLLGECTKQLTLFLEKVLPQLFDDWWEQGVVNNLPTYQQQRIGQSNLKSLGSLDLYALLKVIDQNWYQISRKLNLTAEARHFVKEMQTVRNRWAHIGTEELSVEDIYRDLDTLQRFGKVIQANLSLLKEIQNLKVSLVSGKIHSSSPHVNFDLDKCSVETEFILGQIVSLKSNTKIQGAVIAVLPGKPENRYNVFVDGEKRTYYSSQLQDVSKDDEDFQFLTCEEFHSYLTALQIRYPGLSTLYSLNAARIDFIPYQFRPVLKFIRSDRPRLLIADSVGVGKTIEAGLILRELQARRDIRSILIICPRPLVIERKWEIEMKRFDERFTHLDGKTLRYCINEMDLEGVWPEQYQKVIIPYSLFDEVLLYGDGAYDKRKRRKGLLHLDPPPRFDLVIVDEAHHIRNPETYSHKAVRFFCDHAEAVVFLTATPIQLGSYDLYVLLNTLRPDLVIDWGSFDHMGEPNPFINRAITLARAQKPEWATHAAAALDEAASTSWGQAILKNNPEFNRIRAEIADGNIALEDRIQLITDIEALHTFAGIINRTRRRDIGDFTIRKPETVVVEFLPSQKELHDELLLVQAEIFSRIHGDINVKFMLTTIRRQAASCLYGLAPFLEEILSRHIDELSWEEADNSEQVLRIDAIDNIEARIKALLIKAKSLDSYDPKLDALRKIIRNKQNLQNNKIMLFSSFRHTLSYLYQNLKADGFCVAMVHGGTPDEERVELRNRFELPRNHEDVLDVLLFSEIGCEGLDYQFCDCIVNYDIPWNPMRIEQRIGRIDRKGQKSESVAIFNLITPGTVDADIYERCLVRIGVFNNALGGSEEILGEITREIISIAENFSLSEQERGIKLQQLADNKIRLIQEQEELEQRQFELFGIHFPEAQIKKEIEEASSFWLSPNSILRLTVLYLQRICGAGQDYILGDSPLKTLRLSQEARSTLLGDLQKLSRQNTSSYREWENWLKGGNPHLLVTFESDCASQYPESAFIMPLHPIVKQAAMSYDKSKRVITTLKVKCKEVSAGTYEFAIYQWQFHGIREDLVLKPVASSETITGHLAQLLERVEEAQTKEAYPTDSSKWSSLDDQHYKLWSEARKKHRQRTHELAEYRRESLITSHRARISLLEEQLKQADNEKIQKMRQSQIAAAEADYARRVQDLDIAVERADITAETVAYGVIYVEGGESGAE